MQFFSRSKLPIDVLKNIWTVADQPSTSSLDLKKFAVAVRLIQLTQNGQKGQGPTLAVPEGVTVRPAFFDGVSGVSVPLPPAPGQGPPPAQQQPPPSPAASTQLPPVQMQEPPMAMGQGMPQPTPGSRELVAQDPYSMNPQERARYEDLFPQYANADGFVYGKEAVELFMKSGVDQGVLRDIWTIVDRPVDNRLDKLEFAMAMHLIVCISKKNLPPPQGNLPNSLKALKAASSAPAGATQQPTMPPPAAQQQPPKPAAIPSPPGPQSSMGPPPSTSFESAGPPPIVSTGGLSISDAFEGLSTTSGEVHNAPATLPSYVPEPQPVVNPPTSVPEEPVEQTQAPVAYETPAPAPEPVSSGPAQTSKSLASNYDLGDSHQELSKLKAVLQKMQAENISLKAQLGSMTDEEKDVQKELGATVSEISKLSNELQSLRSQVLHAKTRLLEASAELKSAHERKR